MNGRRTLWVISGGIEARPVIERARALGLRVVVSDGSATAPGLALADLPVVANVYGPEETLDAARTLAARHGPPDGVICAAADAPLTAAWLAGEFGLVGPSREAARLATDKLAMKRRLARDGVPVPWFRALLDADELEAHRREEGVPLVVKPVDSRGARGVVRVAPGPSGVDARFAFETAHRNSPTGRVMVERFLDGPQVSTESLVLGDRVATPGLADRNYEALARFAPFVVEDGGQLPSALAADAQRDVCDVVARAARSLGLESGVAKGDIVVHEGRAVVIEIAARLSGGYLCSHHIPLSTGVDFVGAAIRQALGERIDPDELAPRHARGVAQRFFFPRPGRVVAIRGAEEVARRADVALLELRVAPGDEVGEVECHPARAGLVITTAATREEAVAAARAAIDGVAIETEPTGPSVAGAAIGAAPRPARANAARA
ncbi:MAG: ATP-grasp domain-containing protein [Myxococcota bacterium]